MAYESNPAGLGISKRYGPLHLGSKGGVTAGENGEFRWVVEVSAEELDASAFVSMKIPEGYARITAAYVEVEEAFGALDTVDILYDGATILSAPLAVSATGIVVGTLAVSVADGDTAFTIDTSLIDSGSTTGFAKVVVVLERI